jgi:hypothetical protein
MTVATRRLTDFDFSKEGCHVSLVDKAANGETVLVMKSLEEINKAEVQVKMDIVNFLTTFFHMWTDEAATLAVLLGFEQDWFDENYTFEEFNSLGATEVTLLKSASKLEKTEDTLSDYVNGLEKEDLNVLKAFAESFNIKKQEHSDMTTEIEKALQSQKVELEKAANAKVAEANEKVEKAEAKLAEITKAELVKVEAEYLEKAKGYGAEGDALGKAMAVASQSESGLVVIKALAEAHTKLDVALENELGFTGEAEQEGKDTPIVKAMKATYPEETK